MTKYWQSPLAVGPSNEAVDKISTSLFIGTTTKIFFTIGSIVPAVFIFLKFAKFSVITLPVADRVIFNLAVIWPVVSKQYHYVQAAASPDEAANFAAFCAVAAIFDVITILTCCLVYLTRRRKINFRKSDFKILAIFIFCCWFVLFFDGVEKQPKPLWDFYVDAFGLFYLRQALFHPAFWGGATGLFILSVDTLFKITAPQCNADGDK